MSDDDAFETSPGTGIEPTSTELLAAALRADATDLATYSRVLLSTLADAFPPEAVEISRERRLADRLAGRPGEVRGVRIVLGELTFDLSATARGLVASVGRAVRGVTISQKEVGLDEWSRALAGGLERHAEKNAAAAAALGRLLGQGGTA